MIDPKELTEISKFYDILRNGDIVRKSSGRVLKLQDNGNGYKKVTLTINGRQIQKYVHRLVASVHLEPIENKLQVNHINGIKYDNRVENLEWVNNSENQIHAHENGLKANGIDLHNGKFTKEDIMTMRELDKKMNRADIALMFNCSKSTVSDILNGNRYKIFTLL